MNRSKTALATIVLLLSCLTASSTVVGQRIKYQYCFSSDKKTVARILAGDLKATRASVQFFKLNENGNAFEQVSKFDLYNEYVPQDLMFSPNGKFFVAVGNFGAHASQAAAVSVFEIDSGRSKEFSLGVIFKPKEIEQFNSFRPAGIDWYHYVPEFPYDPARRKFIISLKSTLGNPPRIAELDCEKMELEVKDAGFWKARHDELLSSKTQELKNISWFVTGAEGYFYELVDLVNLQIPPISIQRTQIDAFFRLETGSSNARKPKLSLFVLDETQMEFVLAKSITLKNMISPLRFHFSPDRRHVVTFDEDDAMGTSPNSVVIYNLETGKNKSFALKDFMTENDISNLGKIFNNRMWRTESSVSVFDSNGWRVTGEAEPGFVPHVIVDVEAMSVKIDGSFDTKFPKTKFDDWLPDEGPKDW